MKKLLMIVLVVGVLAVAACGSTPVPAPTDKLPTVPPPPTATQPAAPTPAPTLETATATTSESPLGLPNPASQYCVEQGYTSEIRDEAGGQVGYCAFPNGAECEEWAFYRGECTAPSAYP